MDNNRKLEISLEDHILKIITAFNEKKTISYAPKQALLDRGMKPNSLTVNKGTSEAVSWDFKNFDFWIEPIRVTYFQVLYFKNERDGMQVSGKRANLEQAREHLHNYCKPTCVLETLMVDDGTERVFTTTTHTLLSII